MVNGLLSSLLTAAAFGCVVCGSAAAQDWEKYMEAGQQAKDAQNLRDAEKQFNAAIHEAKRSGHPELQLAQSLDGLAGVYRDQKKFARSETLYRQSLDIKEKVLGPWHVNVAKSLDNLAEVLEAEGKRPRAEPLYKRAHDIREQAVSTHPDIYVDGVRQPVLPKDKERAK